MDCIDCIPKVERALTKLTSVSSVNINYYSGIAELSYDPETITPAVIGQYVARATGFSVKLLDLSPAGNKEAFITLPLYFENLPSSDDFKDFEFHIGRDPHVVELQIPIRGDFSRHPRDVLTQFKPYGARIFYSASLNTHDGATRDLIVVAIRTIISATLTIPVLVLAWAKLPHRPVLYGAISLGLTTIIQGLAFPIISSAVRSIIYLRQADMNVLVSVSTLTAYVFSVISYSFETAGKPFSTPFFETSSLLVTLIFLGRTISAMTRRSTGSALNELLKLQKNEVLLAVDEEKEAEPLDSRLLYYNDVIRILPNTHFATDGIVIKGESDVDESSITGESALVYKSSGSRVIAGTVNGVGTLDIQVTRLVHENSLSQIVSLVKQAQSSRPPIQNLIDKLSAIILPAAAISASIAFLVWALILRFAQHRSNTFASVEALTYAIAILAVSCPCAIGLVLPTVVSIAIRRGIREGILFRSTETLQNGHNIDVIAFDKTGTLTTSDLVIESANILVDGAEKIIDVLVKDNKHPISEAIHRYLAPHIQSITDQPKAEVTGITLLPGKGIKASLGGYPLLGGSPEFTGAINHPIFASMCSSGYSLFTVTLAGQTIAFFGLAATPRPNAKDLVSELKRRGKKVFILSGDNRAAVDRLSNTLGVPLEDTRAGCTPEDKSAAIRSFQAEAQRVCFVGDGTNDGPALSCAEVALSVAAGSEVALTAAGAILLGSDIRRGVLALLDIAQASRTRVRLALIWCVIYNIFAILLASGALVKVRIEPRWAGIGEVVSLVPVVLIAFSLEILWIWRSLKLPRVNST
ncbi:heavy metal translocatin [Serendipita vermifera]|nr:heavy metal translocatin [Serendipita vermifera]